MSWRIVLQPNEKYSRFSEVFDDFTHMNLTRNAAWALCRDDAGQMAADEKLTAADGGMLPWRESLDVIRRVHGEERMKTREQNGNTPKESTA